MDLSPTARALPAITDLERVMEILGVPGDPVFIMKDHSITRRRVELLAHIAAWIVDGLGPAETLADLDVEGRADLHWDADRDVAASPGRSPDGVRLLDLQLARLAWVQHAIMRGRGPRPHPVTDTVVTAIAAITQLVEAWRDSRRDPLGAESKPDGHDERLDPVLADALLMVRDAADHLAVVLRTRSRTGI